jgi:hypothetical protein
VGKTRQSTAIPKARNMGQIARSKMGAKSMGELL